MHMPPSRRRSAMVRRARIATVAGVLASAVVASPALASPPRQFGPFTNTYSFIGFNCEGFDILIEGEGTDTFTLFRDDSGDVTRVLDRARYPHDVLTNTVTGRSIVVRAAFDEFIDPDPASPEGFIKTVVGFRYMVNEPGVGVTIRDVGRITYGDLEQTIVLWEAGEHDLALDPEFQPTFCAALA